MRFLQSVYTFLASEDGTSGFEQVVIVGCTVILCMSIQITAHRQARVTCASRWHAPLANPAIRIG